MSSSTTTTSSCLPEPAIPVHLKFYQEVAAPKTNKFDTSKLLPKDFTPSPYTVICGRGTHCNENIGNRRLKSIVSCFVGKYAAANKEDKSQIVTTIMDIVYDGCRGYDSPAFVTHRKGQWWEVNAMPARERVGGMLRDFLHTKYRSSSKSKLARRRELAAQYATLVEQEDASVMEESVSTSSSVSTGTSTVTMNEQEDRLETVFDRPFYAVSDELVCGRYATDITIPNFINITDYTTTVMTAKTDIPSSPSSTATINSKPNFVASRSA